MEEINLPGNLVLTTHPLNNHHIITIWGTLFSEIGPVLNERTNWHHEMWECEVVIRPVRKYSPFAKDDKLKPSYKFSGYRADQMITDGFDNPKNWGELYWEKKETSLEP